MESIVGHPAMLILANGDQHILGIDNSCLDGLQFITDASTKVQWSPQGYNIEDPATGGVSFKLVMFSKCNLTDHPYNIGFTVNATHCVDIDTSFKIKPYVVNGSFSADVQLSKEGKYYICIKDQGTYSFHQGQDPRNTFTVELAKVKFSLSLSITIILIVICQLFAALFSGLNLGLLSLDMKDLKIFKETGTYRERYYANKIIPLRRHPNYLLCSIVFAQTLLNAINTLFLDNIAGGIVATVVATLMITICGEIIPQALCSRFGLLIGAVTSPLTWCIMIITAPLSWPFGKFLDMVLGDNPPMVYTRDHISYMIREHSFDLDKTEQRVVEGVLALRNKPAMQYMTKLKDVFMLDYNERFDDSLFIVISKSGYSRIPVFKKDRGNICGVVHIKDLAMLDTSNPRTIGMISDAFNLPYERCKDTDMLNTLLESIERRKSHMIIVEHQVEKTMEAVGIITIEDVVENLLSLDIRDEYDDLQRKKSRKAKQSHQTDIQLRMPSNYKSGAIQFLRSLDPFSESNLSLSTLSKLVHKCYVEKDDRTMKICMVKGTVNKHFMLILSGSVIVEAGAERLTYDAGPYCHFGLLALKCPDRDHIPDFSIFTDQPLRYIWMSKADWQAALAEHSSSELAVPRYPVNDGALENETI